MFIGRWFCLLALTSTLVSSRASCQITPATPAFVEITEWPRGLRNNLRGTLVRIALPENAPDRKWDDALMAKFQALTGINVEIIRPGNDTTTVLPTYLREFTTGAPRADVYAIDMVWPGILADYAEDLRPMFGALPETLPALVENDRVKGKLVAVPYFVEISLLYYRTDLLHKYHFTRPPETWRELESQARTIQRGERTGSGDRFWGYLWQGAASEALTCNALEWQVSQGGGELVDADGDVSIAGPAMIALLDRARTWIGDISPPDVTSHLEDDSLRIWTAGEAAFMRNWPYAIAESAKAVSRVRQHVGVSILPRGNGGHTRKAGTLGGFQLMVSKASANKEAAVELVRFLTSPEIQRFNAIARGYLPARSGLYTDPAIARSNPFLETLKHAVLEDSIKRPATVTGSRYDQISRTYFTAVRDALTGRISPRAAVADLERKLRDITANRPAGLAAKSAQSIRK